MTTFTKLPLFQLVNKFELIKNKLENAFHNYMLF